MPFKRYAIGSVFRGERPAKGRFREFVQCDFDTIGTESAGRRRRDRPGHPRRTRPRPACPTSRSRSTTARSSTASSTLAGPRRDAAGRCSGHSTSWPRSAARPCIDELAQAGDAGRARADGRPGAAGPRLRRGRPRRRRGLAARSNRRSGSDPSVAQGIGNLRTVLDLLDAAGVPRDRLAIDLGLARGLDYYTGIVFETTVKGWEKFGSVASGGRYDNLASLFTPRRLPGVGASIGLDRLLALLDEAGWLKSASDDRAGAGGELSRAPIRPSPSRWPRGCGPRASAPRSIPTRSRSASRWATARPRGHKLAVIVGPDEQARQVFNLRNLATRQEDKGLAWSVLEDSVESALEIIKQEGAGS